MADESSFGPKEAIELIRMRAADIKSESPRGWAQEKASWNYGACKQAILTRLYLAKQ